MDVAEAPEQLQDMSEGLAEIYVNIGRKDGARPEDFHSLLAEKADLLVSDTSYIRVKQRHAFIGIRKDLANRAISALNGAFISGRQAVAELARARTDSRGSKVVSET